MEDPTRYGVDEDYSPPIPDALDLVVETDSLVSIAAAERYERVARFHREGLRDAVPYRGATVEMVERSLRLELAAALRMTEAAAGRLMGMADALTRRYPGVLDALRGARTTVRHAEILVGLIDTLAPEQRPEVIETATAWAEALPVGTFQRRLRALIDAVRADTQTVRHLVALADRRVAIEPAGDGMAWLMTLLPAVEARAVFDRATKIARAILAEAEAGDARSLSQVRSDVVADLLIDGHVDAHPDTARGIRADVVVTVPALSLLDDAHAATHPATVEGVGPVPIERARELCGGQREWMRVLTHPETGAVLSVGRTTYRPPAPLRRFVRWRGGTCQAPGCHRTAGHADLDHTIAWEHGGRTDAANLAPLCRGHHTLKHHSGWNVEQRPDGTLHWTSPTGRVYDVPPERTAPRFTPAGERERADAPAPF